MTPASLDSSRLERLSKFFSSVLHGKRKVTKSAETKLLLEAICHQEDPQACIESVVAHSPALSALQSGLRFDLTPSCVNQSLCPFINYLSDPGVKQVCNGQYLKQLLQIIVKPPTLWRTLLLLYQDRLLEQDSLQAFAWLLLELLSDPISTEIDILQDAEAIIADGFLSSSPSHTIRTLGYKIQNVLLTKRTSTPFEDPECAPGGRHDNDFKDFRQIAICPTADEFLSTEKPFYRRADAIDEAPPEDRVVIHLDNQFRLLREDMLAELREDLQVITKQKSGRRSIMILRQLSLVGVSCGDEIKPKPCTLAVECKLGLQRLTNLPRKPKDQRKDFLRNSSKFLRHQAFGCLIRGNEIVAFANVDRQEDPLLRDPPVVMLQVNGNEPFRKALLAFKTAKDLQFLVVDTSVFAYEPILRCLQEKTNFPLAKDLLLRNPKEHISQSPCSLDTIVKYLQDKVGHDIQHILKTTKSIKLDQPQMDSLLAGLTQAISLIQGPPGTGKSFIGALLAKALHRYTKEKILVISYTNHALDQTLEDFLKVGIPKDDIVRLGPKSKSTPQTADLNLSEQKTNYKRSAAGWSVINNLKAEADDLQSALTVGFNSYSNFSLRWQEILEYLEFSDRDYHFYEALTMPDEEDGMTRVGKGGKSVDAGYLFERWSKGQDAGIFTQGVPEHQKKIWAMDSNARHSLLEGWANTLLEERVSSLSSLREKFDDCQKRLNEAKFGDRTTAILQEKRVIGCTTTYAAMHSREIQSASPGIILVEEAGEILESHILTAMSAGTKQLILIGDHQQLRPKVKNYTLTVAKAEGYDLDRSLFERLVLAGYPHTTLINQHRMAPEISSLVRNLTYPDLQDAKITKNHPKPRGLQDRVVFFNHHIPEVEDLQLADRRDAGAVASRRNGFEADMVLKIVRYLAQQGYGTDQLVVLTPYLGQLRLLFDKLSEENDPVLNDLDSFDLVRAGLLSHAGADLTKRPIRISTIDNYQGEESDIVIGSLTRSNDNGDIGFMSAPERLNVLLSRARISLILIGNADTFMTSRRGKDTWMPLLEQLKDQKHMYDGLPVRCEQHPQKLRIIQNVRDFDTECPDGGCAEPCGTTLNCGLHACPQRCHQLFDHSKMKCPVLIESLCLRKHKQSRHCHETTSPCWRCENEDRKQEQRKQRDLKLDAERETKRRNYASRLSNIQDKIDHERRLQRERYEEGEHEKVLRQHEQDLKNLRESSLRTKEVPSKDTKLGKSTDDQQRAMSRAAERPRTTIPPPAGGVQEDNKSPELLHSSAKEDWQHQKEFEGVENEALDSLMDMIGLEDVKEKFLSIKSRIDTAIRQNIKIKDERFGVALLGNPGTGKTTVARLYAEFLTSVGALPGNFFKETTGSRLANDGVSGCKSQIEEILNNGGGVLFIDEAYQLVSGQSFGGGGVLDFLLAEVENLTGKVVFVLAGYNKQMEAFFAHNPGIPSRFPHELQFKDYNDTELLSILVQKIKKKYGGRMRLEDGSTGLYARIVARRIGRGRGREGFGNARAVENVCAIIAGRQATRIQKERRAGAKTDDMLLTKEDLISPEPSIALQKCDAYAKLQMLTGLIAVKESVQALVENIQANYARELDEEPLIEYNLNRVFLGSPGTGKTSVAKLYGQILADIGMLSNGEVVVKNPADFIGSVMGESEKNTKGILASTSGKVLVIDEAYGLYGGGKGDGGGAQGDIYRTAIIDTIVAEVQSTPGEDRCVLLLGYKDQLENMFHNVNPGLSRRFPLDSAFVFEDFSDDEMKAILEIKLNQQGFKATDQGMEAAQEVLRRARNRPNFGNAGEIDILLNNAKARHQKRLMKKNGGKRTALLEAQDFDEDFDRGKRAGTNIQTLFKGVVGCTDLISQLEGYQKVYENMKSLGLDPREQIPFNFLFRGPPGTGKTTTARKMGKVYYDMGFLGTAEVIESSATDLVGQYVGQTGPKAQGLLEKALGKVLFIDEAYRLAEGHFAKEAMDEIVDCITKPRYAQKLIIILAGYDADINRLMSINPGLTSRFPETIVFNSLRPEQCVTLLTQLLQSQKRRLVQSKRGLDLAVLVAPRPEFFEDLKIHFTNLASLSGWANARDVQLVGKAIFGKTIKSDSTTGDLVVTEEMVVSELHKLNTERAHRGQVTTKTDSTSQPLPLPPMMPQFDGPRTMPTHRSSHGTNTRPEPFPLKPPTQAEGPPPQDHPRDAGVSDATWHRLQHDAALAHGKEQEYAQLVAHESALREAAKIADEKDAAAEAAAAASKADVDNEAKRRHEEERLSNERRRRAWEAEIEALRRKREEKEMERRKEQEAQKKLRKMGVCPVGFPWIKQAGGYRCAGGSHWVGDGQLGMG